MAEGYKDWAAGDILTAADLEDYTVKQSVMRFADSSARTTALSGVLAEGMMSYLKDTDSVEVYDGSSWAAVAGGKILQVVSTTKTDTFSASMTANSEADITGLSVTLTPSSASSKVFVVFNTGGARGTNVPLFNVRLYRDSTEIGSGAAAGSRETVFMGGYTGATDINSNMFLSGNYLDSPASTSALTYKLKVVNPDPTAATYTFYVNRTGTDSNSSEYVRFSSTITAFEVSA